MKKRGFDRKRRLFFVGVVATAGSLYAAAVGRGALKACGIDELGVSLADLQPLIRIGEVYLQESANSEELSAWYGDWLNKRPKKSPGLARATRGQLLAVKCRAQSEFQRGETVTCDGWLLARSEARLCALIATIITRADVT